MPISTRRTFLRACLLTPVAAVIAACGQQVGGSPAPTPAAPAATSAPEATVQPTVAPAATSAPQAPLPTAAPAAAPAASLPPTPACDDDPDATLEQTAGPFYTPNTPERTSLREPGIVGTPLVLTGFVLTTDCQPVARTMIDFWHADDAGAYDNVGFRLRGHQYTDAQGAYRLETIMPGLYPGRTRHIHVIVQAPDRPPLTTQLYFPGEPGNERDRIFHPSLVVEMGGGEARFTFVVG